jgi:hypothetical protein
MNNADTEYGTPIAHSSSLSDSLHQSQAQSTRPSLHVSSYFAVISTEARVFSHSIFMVHPFPLFS